MRQYNGRIIECYWDQKTGWNFMRVRVDKSHPNGYTTAKSELNMSLVTVVMAIIIIIHCRCVSEYSSAGDEGVAFGGD